MSLRYEILKACASNPGAPIDEIADAIKHDRKKTGWAVRDCAKEGLLSKRRDDVTGQPGYTLTEAGKERLADGPTKQGGNAKHSQPAVEQNTGSSALNDDSSSAEGAAVQPETAPVAVATPSAVPVAADVKAQGGGQDVPTLDNDDMPPADASLLALANRELADRLARVAHVLRGSGLEGLKDLDDGADLQTAAAALTGAYQMALAESSTLRRQILNRDNAMEIMDAQVVEAREKLAPIVPGDIDTSDMGLVEIAERVAAGHADLTARIENKDDELFVQAGTIVGLRSQLETLQRDAMRGASLMSGQDRYTAAGYLVRASKRKPRTLLDKDKARDAALSSIRAGAQRAEVFALVPIGHALRGVEWRPA